MENMPFIILVINCGSSSLKYEIFSFPQEHSLCKGVVEKIGKEDAIVLYQSQTKRSHHIQKITDHTNAFNVVMNLLTDSEIGVIADTNQVHAIGHRVVHGGEIYSSSVMINDHVMGAIEELLPFAPLHNPANLSGIQAAKKLFPHCKHIAVFDTAFHQTMPAAAFTYPLPYEIYKKYGIRRYGFHGTSHYYVSREGARCLGKKPEDINLITCHLGNGCSITAIEKGRSIDTTMGFTPLEGLMMGTRCGSIDPAILVFLQEQNMDGKEIDAIMNKKSGLLGISGVSNDMRDIEKAAINGNKRAELALEMFAHSVQKFIGAYAALLQTVDMLVFTAGVGQNDPAMRKRICEPLPNIGMQLDSIKNEDVNRGEGIISADYSNVKIAVIETKEELQIARDSYSLINRK